MGSLAPTFQVGCLGVAAFISAYVSPSIFMEIFIYININIIILYIIIYNVCICINIEESINISSMPLVPFQLSKFAIASMLALSY